MNETTWIISPNWLAWGLLVIIAVSLVVAAWALCKIFAIHAIKNHKGLFSIPPFYKGMIWAIGIIEVFIVCIVAYIIYKKVDMGDGSIGGVYMSFFSILITFLVGFQIYNNIVSREQIKTISDEIHKRTSKVLSYNLFQVFFVQGRNEHRQRNFESAFNYYFRCVDCATKGELYSEITNVMQKLKELVDDKQAKVGINDCEVYLDIISQISHKDKEYIYKRLEEIKSPEASELGMNWDAFTVSGTIK